MSAYDIIGFLRTAYRPFAHCIPSKRPPPPEYCVPKGTSPSLIVSQIISEIMMIVDVNLWLPTVAFQAVYVNKSF